VRPGDTVVIVDRVGAAYSQTVSTVLTDTWDAALQLLSVDEGNVGALSQDEQTLVWRLTDVTPNTFHPITKTFRVRYGSWLTGTLREQYRVAEAQAQMDDVTILFERHQPAIVLDKSGPGVTRGSAISFTLTMSSAGGYQRTMMLTDALPTGLAYAGGLTTTFGLAWADGNTVYWTNASVPVVTVDALILTPDSDVTSLRNALLACPGTEVTQWDAATRGTPSASDLLAYDVVVLGNDYLWTSMDKEAVGDALADYIDQGGKVIESLYVQSFDEWGFAGRYMDDGYSPLTPATLDNWSTDTMQPVNPAHPLLAGVLSISDNWGHQDPGLAPGAALVARWQVSGYPYVATRGNVVALNQLLHANADWSGDVPRLLCNSMRFLGLEPVLPPPLPTQVALAFSVRPSGAGDICNRSRLSWAEDYTDDEHCLRREGTIYVPLAIRD
jgi:hypothetical protein